jgi:3D (Asp-Asp-Asp) domain-containing protein
MPITLMGALVAFFVLTGSAGHASAPELPSYTVDLTAYNAVAAQTDSDPFTTASGAYSNPEVVVARSNDLAEKLPFGTIIAIIPAATSTPDCGLKVVSGTIGYRVIADTMNQRFTNTLDVLLPTDATVTVGGKTYSTARALGSCKGVAIKVVGHIDLTNVANLPKDQKTLAQMVNKALALSK